MLKRDDQQIKDFKWEILNFDGNGLLGALGGNGDLV
jgi:hypothetical protein